MKATRFGGPVSLGSRVTVAPKGDRRLYNRKGSIPFLGTRKEGKVDHERYG